MMNSETDQTFVVLPYKIDVEDTGRAIINRIQAELEEGPRKAHFLEIFNLSVVAFAESIEIPDGISEVEAKKLIDESGLEVHSAITLQEAADLVKKVLA